MIWEKKDLFVLKFQPIPPLLVKKVHMTNVNMKNLGTSENTIANNPYTLLLTYHIISTKGSVKFLLSTK